MQSFNVQWTSDLAILVFSRAGVYKTKTRGVSENQSGAVSIVE